MSNKRTDIKGKIKTTSPAKVFLNQFEEQLNNDKNEPTNDSIIAIKNNSNTVNKNDIKNDSSDIIDNNIKNNIKNNSNTVDKNNSNNDSENDIKNNSNNIIDNNINNNGNNNSKNDSNNTNVTDSGAIEGRNSETTLTDILDLEEPEKKFVGFYLDTDVYDALNILVKKSKKKKKKGIKSALVNDLLRSLLKDQGLL